MRAKTKKHIQKPAPKSGKAPDRGGPSRKMSTIKPSGTGPQHAPESALYSFSASVPPSHDETMMCALPRSPGSIFVFWEIAPDSLDSLRKTVGEESFQTSKWVVRVIDVTGIVFDGANAWQTLDIIVDPNERKKYVEVPEPGRTYLLKYGVLTTEKSFFEIVQSNACAVPRKGVSDRLDEGWTMAHTPELIRISADALGVCAAESRRLNGVGIALGEGSGSGSIM